MVELHTQGEAARKQAAEEIAQAELEARQKQAALKAAREANIQKLADAAKKEAAAHKAAQEAAEKAHQQAIAARKSQEKRQIADHKKKMAARKANFQKQYEHVWASGPTGISVVQMTFTDGVSMDALVEGLFTDNLIADVENVSSGVSRQFLRGGKLVIEDGEQSLIMTTTNENLETVMKVIADKTPDPKYDLVVTTPATGNKEYIEWVKSNTITREAAQKAMQ